MLKLEYGLESIEPVTAESGGARAGTKGADLGSAGVGLPGFESRPPHYACTWILRVFVVGLLAFIGLGLYDLRDISVGALEFLRRAESIFVETYTSIVPGLDIGELERVIGKEIMPLPREELENRSGEVLIEHAERGDTALLVPGNPFVATTHTALRVIAERKGIRTIVYPSASIVGAVVAATGLEIYKFGPPATVTYPEARFGYYPTSTYYVLSDNLSRGLHTLLLLDIRREEGRAMTAREALEVLAMLEERENRGLISGGLLVIAIARATSPDQQIRAGTMECIKNIDLGPPPHSIVVPGVLGPVEMEILEVVAGASREVLEEWNLSVKRGLGRTS